jgi:hypothetical protein
MWEAMGPDALMPPAWIRFEMSSCSHASTVCTRSVGAGAYVPAGSGHHTLFLVVQLCHSSDFGRSDTSLLCYLGDLLRFVCFSGLKHGTEDGAVYDLDPRMLV